MKKVILLILFVFAFSLEVTSNIVVPKGFKISVFAEVPKARAMKYVGNGILFVGTKESKVYVVINKNFESSSKDIRVLIDGLEWPVGLDYYRGDLYVSSHSVIYKLEDVMRKIDKRHSVDDLKVVFDRFPKDTAHGWKYIRFGPDGKLYVPVGAPCNVCKRDNKIYSTITRMNPDGSDFEIFAHGVRNSVGFDWDPITGYMWFSDNGRDWMGDDLPPDEINVAKSKELHFGFPYIHGKDVLDPEFGDEFSNIKDKFQKPVWELPAHVAPLGIKFYTGSSFPNYYKNGLFIAEHGSWNRSTKIGYRVSFLKIDENRIPISYEIFASFIDGRNVYGRPVDIELLEDGSIIVSDDKNGKIYRIQYSGDK
ncbi:MAG: PQQ-dependent sugar dehydrogenase [Brevinematia bacterium]